MAGKAQRSGAKRSGKEFAVIGLGTFGSSLARRLEAMEQTVLAIDEDIERVQAIAADVTSAVTLDATNEDALAEVDIASFGTVIVTMANSFEPTVLVVAHLKSIGIPRVICTAETRRHRDILLRVGADQIILSDEDSGVRLAETLASPNLLERVLLDDSHSLTEMRMPDSLAGQPLSSLAKYGITVLLIQRPSNLMPCPSAETLLQEGDTLFVMGQREPLLAVASLP